MLATSILLYVATNAIFELEIDPATVTVQLIDINNGTHDFIGNTVQIDCKTAPVEVNVLTDLSKPFITTRGKR